MSKKIFGLLFLFLVSVQVNAQSCYQNRLNDAISLYNKGSYSDAIRVLEVAKKCTDANITVLNDWINKAKNKSTRAVKVTNNERENESESSLQVVNKLSEGLAVAVKAGKWGFVNEKNEIIIPLIYDYCLDFSEGLAAVQKNNKWGFINKEGRLVISLKYTDAFRFREGIVSVKRGNKWGYIDASDNVIVPFQFEKAYGFSEGLAAVQKDKKWGYIDKRGSLVIPCQFDDVDVFGGSFSDGLCWVKINSKWRIINKEGKDIIPPQYDLSQGFSEGLIGVGKNGKYGYINLEGREIVPLKYDFVKTFSEGLAAVQLNGKWGYVNTSGALVIPVQFGEAYDFTNGKAKVLYNGNYTLISKAEYEEVNKKDDKDGDGYPDMEDDCPDSKGNIKGCPPEKIMITIVTGGTYKMGNEAGEPNERPAHDVRLSDFYITKYEITQSQWKMIMGNVPEGNVCDNCPVVNVSWDDVQSFIRELNLKTGKIFRLPTEAEWEYAARGGNLSKRFSASGSNDINEVAWYGSNSNNSIHPVAQKFPNELGLYDMSGNVWEWCSDWYDENYYNTSPAQNPKGPATGVNKILRGGSWKLPSHIIQRISDRHAENPRLKTADIGFRLVMEK